MTLYQGALLLGAIGEEHLDADGGVTLSEEERQSIFGSDPVEDFLKRSIKG